MLRLSTSGTGPGLAVWASEGLARQAEALVRGFEQMLATGTRFSDGQTIQIGWVILRIQADVDGHLELWEPDFRHMPIAWVLGVDSTLRHTTLQREVCRVIAAEPQFPALNHSAVVAPNLAGFDGDVQMARDAIGGSDSGWLFRPEAYTESNSELQSLYEATLGQRRLIPFLAVPEGSVVKHTASTIAISYQGRSFSSREEPFLERLLKRH